MKKTLLLLIIFFKCFIVYSQENQIKSYLQVQDSIFQHLDKNRISTGSLYDRVYQWADLSDFNPKDTITYSYAKQAWYELYLSSYDQKSYLPASEIRKKEMEVA